MIVPSLLRNTAITGARLGRLSLVKAPSTLYLLRGFAGNKTVPFPRTSFDELEAAPGTLTEKSTDNPAESESASASASPASEAEFESHVAAPARSNSNGSSLKQPSGISEEWSTSFAGLGEAAFRKEVSDVLTGAINEHDIEIKPDGLIYLPEIKYRRILNKAFGPGGWGMAPRSETNVGQGIVSREWVLICQGRFVATARGEQEFFKPSGVPTASEAAKSNALMRCCKDLGVASELWDPRFIREFKKKHCVEVWCQDTTGKKKKLWRRKDSPSFEYPWKENGYA